MSKPWDFPVKKSFDCDTCQDAYEVNGDPCQDCCSHEFDPSEGFMCINCGKDADMGALIDAAEYTHGGDR